MMRVLRVLRVLFSALRGRFAVTLSRGGGEIHPHPPHHPQAASAKAKDLRHGWIGMITHDRAAKRARIYARQTIRSGQPGQAEGRTEPGNNGSGGSPRGRG